jgi:hypothetical protein
MQLTVYKNSEERLIPKGQGIYAFFLDLMSPAKIGLVGQSGFTEAQLTTARDSLHRRVEKALRIYRSSQLEGEIRELKKGTHFAKFFRMQAEEMAPLRVLEDLAGMRPQQLMSYLMVARFTTLFAPPIYVGITREQTLQERYRQHKYNFDSQEQKGSFGARLRESGFDWDDIVFACIEFSQGEDDSTVLRILERHLQAISNPMLSLA